MKESDGIKNTLLEFFAKAGQRYGFTAERYFSKQAGTLAIGTDPDEWWTSHEQISHAFQQDNQTLGPLLEYLPGSLSVFEEGSVGWAAYKLLVHMPTGKKISVRVTAVFHMEDESWKIVQHHASIGVPNAEAFG